VFEDFDPFTFVVSDSRSCLSAVLCVGEIFASSLLGKFTADRMQSVLQLLLGAQRQGTPDQVGVGSLAQTGRLCSKSVVSMFI
jgi:hypothetical protein